MRFLAPGVLLLAPIVAACATAPARDPSGTDATRAIHALFEADWENEMREHPTWASSLGDARYGDRWDDVSLEAEARRDAHDVRMLTEIEKIPRAGLAREDALSWDLFRYRYAVAVEGQSYREHLLPINQRGGIQTADELADALPFKTDKDFADWNARLTAFGTYADQTIATLEAGVKEGIVHPRLQMERVTAQIDKQIVQDPTKSPFYAPYKDHPGHDARAAAAAKAITATVIPAFARLRSFWTATYLPACKPDAGAWQLPRAPARYAYLARLHTTTKLTPDEIHAIGLREVARIRGEMEAAKARAGFTGTTKELFAFLRTDPRFFVKDGADLITAYRQVGQRIDPLLPRVFSRLPKAPYTVQAVPENVAPDTTTAYYREPAADGSRPGTYFVNLYKPETRPKWEMMALSLHESVPGHHLQIALAMEQANIPKFRRYGGYNAFIEGWALYAESLGDELGLYDDPWSKIGQLTYEMWRAVRLVVDTGIHHLKWDRQRAIDFFLENAPKAELDVVNEVDRYIVWPGQALSYKIGELKIKELRKKTKLDVRAFHEAVLGEGPLPLDILEQQLKEREPR